VGFVVLAGCADPAGDALEAVVVEAESLVAKIEAGTVTDAELDRLADDLGPRLEDRAREEARKLGPARRAELRARWQAVSERLRARLVRVPRGGDGKILAPQR